MVHLKAITSDNLEAVLALKVAAHQTGYVSSNAHSLAQAYVHQQTAWPFAVYDDETPVGFIMLGWYEARRQHTLWKFMMDERYQGKGLGREALLLGLAYLKEELGAREIYTGVSIGNHAAQSLYRSVGFAETGLEENGMIEMRRTC